MGFNENLNPLSNVELKKLAKKLEIKNFRGIFMRDTLPKKVKKEECGIINLDLSMNIGTHWVCYLKNKNRCFYFDSFGLDPPIELQKYLNSEIELSTFQIQKFDTHNCGHYCLLVLKLLEKYDFVDIILDLFS
jgi:hypothetical protein